MLTAYGKFLKKFRIDRNETLADMSGKLGISSAYLSAIENGTREIPAKMSVDIKAAYNLPLNEFLGLITAEKDTPRKTVTIELDSLPEDPVYKETAVSFGVYLNMLDKDVVQKIYDLIEAGGPYKYRGKPGIIGDDL
jgi:HTH-type transcriptional regulator, competence development regulator